MNCKNCEYLTDPKMSSVCVNGASEHCCDFVLPNDACDHFSSITRITPFITKHHFKEVIRIEQIKDVLENTENVAAIEFKEEPSGGVNMQITSKAPSMKGERNFDKPRLKLRVVEPRSLCRMLPGL